MVLNPKAKPFISDSAPLADGASKPDAKGVDQKVDPYKSLRASLPRSFRLGLSSTGRAGLIGKSKYSVGQQSSRSGGLVSMKMVVAVNGTTNGSGVCTTAVPIDPSVNTTEWAAISLLYDQYRVRACTLRFWISGFGAMTDVNPGLILVYDPTDLTALAGTKEGAEYGDHMLITPAGFSGTNVYYVTHSGKPHVYSPQMISSHRSPTASVPTREEWSSTASPVAYGYIKPYIGVFANSIPALQGILSLEVEFRSRT